MQIMLMNIIEDDAKIIYLIPKGTKFTKPGKLGLTPVPKICFHKFQCCTYNFSKKHILEYYSCFLLVALNINNLQTFFSYCNNYQYHQLCNGNTKNVITLVVSTVNFLKNSPVSISMNCLQ